MVAWINPLELRAVWHPGAVEPGGGPWPTKDVLAGSYRYRLVAAFNSAFRLEDSHGGVYAGGRTHGKLQLGAASLVIDKQGTISVGAWGSDVSMTPDVAAVRQNLSLLVSGGQVVPGIQSNNAKKWGATIGNAYCVWRSGIGVTATGGRRLWLRGGPALRADACAAAAAGGSGAGDGAGHQPGLDELRRVPLGRGAPRSNATPCRT